MNGEGGPKYTRTVAEQREFECWGEERDVHPPLTERIIAARNWIGLVASDNLDPPSTCPNLRLRLWRRPSNQDAQLWNGTDSSRRCPSAD